mgnify:FL=1
MNELHFIFQKTIDIPNPKRTRQSPGVKAASSTSEALFDFLVKSEEAEDEKKIKITTVFSYDKIPYS